jgi:hypothetical protein
MRSVEDYLALIPPEHAGKQKFMAEVALLMQPLADIQVFLQSLPAAFALPTAIGVQLDKTGAWIGLTRIIPVPIPNAAFSFDTPGLGFDQGYWLGTFGTPADYLVSLDDDSYRRLLGAKVLANNSKGRIADIQGVLNAYFAPAAYPNTRVFVIDGGGLPVSTLYFTFDDPARGFDVGSWYPTGMPLTAYNDIDMKITVALAGDWPSIVDLEILHQEILPFRGAAVRIDWEVTTANGAPVFGLGIENEFIAGLGVGAWGADPDFVAQNLIAT